MTTNIFFGVFGGLGLFLFGMKVMSEGLQKIAGSGMRKILGLLTKTTLSGVAVGAGVTALVQSSSVTTIMLIGFVQAGLIGLKQSIGIILGANIGTTITGQIIAFKIHKYALPLIGLGVALNFFAPKKKLRYVGQSILGFGLIFFGLAVMTSVFGPLKQSPEFRQLFVTFSKNPLLAVLTGAILTMVVQSSSATVGITIVLAGAGLLNFTTAFAVILGDNIGTTITAQLAAINANVTAKRAAWAHTLFNVIGAGYMLILLHVKIQGQPIFLYFINLITPGNAFAGQNIERAVANSHSFFNILNCIIFLPLAGFLAFVVTKIVRGDVEYIKHDTKYLDKRMLVTPEIAIGQAKKEIVRLAHFAKEQLSLGIDSIFTHKHRVREQLFDKIKRREEVVNHLENEIATFIIRIDQQSITEEQSRTTAGYLHLIHDLERIGDISENIMDLVVLKEDENLKFSQKAFQEIKRLSQLVLEAVSLAIDAFDKWDKQTSFKALEAEGKVDAVEQEYRDNHIQRLNRGECNPASGVIFLDVLSNLERAGDHAENVAKKIVEINTF
ncbi:MAG: Na/Pi cotransporter family protein [Candidatus Saganbacteria bacterium]|nr:Na/Pi cotransporter family protein [Candidatus Saganbacteria bacterium]